jgi:hypothetical protein
MHDVQHDLLLAHLPGRYAFTGSLSDAPGRVLTASFPRSQPEQQAQRWLSVESAAVYLDMTPVAIRSAVKREQLVPCRTPTGRLRFSREQLDAWVRGGDAE